MRTLVGYFVLTALAFFAFEKKRFWLYLLGIVLVGVLFEAVQYVMPTRTFNVYDVVGNCLGVLLFKEIRRLRRFSQIKDKDE